jgi:hypothetical protein
MIACLFIGVLLADRAQQEYGSDAISNRSLNRVSVEICWIFGWGRKNPAQPSLHGEDESCTGSCWPLGCTGPRERAGKENREGGHLSWFRKETKIRPKTIERIDKPFQYSKYFIVYKFI